MKKSLIQTTYFFQKIWYFLTAPFEKLPHIEDARRAMVTTSFLLFSSVSVGIEQIMAGNTPRIALFLLIGGYFLARTHWYKFATLLLIISLTFPSYFVAFNAPDPEPNRIISAFVWIIIPILLSSLIYSVQTVLVLSAINIVTISVLPFLSAELTFKTISGALGLISLTSAVVLIVMIQRNQIEGDRQQELRENQESLQKEITKRIQTQQEREKLIKELEIKNAELERFTYTVSHDLKSPLVTIKGFLGMLKKDMEENRQDLIQKDFERISDAAKKMGVLLSELLELSRIGRVINSPAEVDLVKLTHEALDMLAGRIQSSNVTINISPDLPTVYGDHIRLREVFENLIDNAAKYMGDQPSPLIEIGQWKSETESIIYVKDNGIGIESQFHTKIFGLFEKLSGESEGTGIGLALIKRIIEVHGGRMWVESEGLGKGSTFCFTIPNRQNSTPEYKNIYKSLNHAE